MDRRAAITLKKSPKTRGARKPRAARPPSSAQLAAALNSLGEGVIVVGRKLLKDGQRGEIIVAYTVWSRKRGAGKEIINKLAEYAKQNHFKRVVTLSPLTPMATSFHIKNGAKQIKVSEDTQNFEYDLNKKI